MAVAGSEFGERAGAPVVSVKSLQKIYNGKILAVDKISFDVHEGEIFGFLGPNGAGKTTTISMLTTLVLPTGGEAKVLGLDVTKHPAKVREVIGLVPQDLTVDDDLKGRENMELQAKLYHVSPKDAKERIDELLKLVGLADAQNRFVKTYSGGMRKRLELAEGLIHRPKILFLDEPTLGLDVQTRASIWQHIRRLKSETNMTIFVTTHYLEEADSLCDRIAIIDHGKIVALDTPENLKKSVGGDVISLEFSACDESTLELIRSIPDVALIHGKCEGNKIRIRVPDSGVSLPRIMSALFEKKLDIVSVAVKKPSLDQAFLEYTGKELRDEEGGFDKARAALQSRRRRG